MAPAVVLAVALVLVLTQLFHLLFPRRVRYWKRLGLTAAAVLLGELAGSYILPPGPRIGDLHPAWDLLLTLVFQLLANRFLR
ncbi:MAG: hypothetical protein QOE92_1225 [Chloroflexota bacterium]|nr:hypothetical protein [Chloroflexota bacterium]